MNPVPGHSRLYSHGFKDDTTLDSTIRIQHIVEQNVKFKYVTSRSMIPKSIRPMYNELVERNSIIIDDDCHNEIIENIVAMEHLDYDEYFSSTEDDNFHDDSSVDEDDIIQ